MNEISIKNKQIAKNTIFLYIRMFFSMGISLYTSRVILSTLGIIDYGIWNVVGGVIAMFSFLNTSMSSATSRFLMFELGTNDKNKLQKVFSGACTIHLLIAISILILGETIGLWFLENKLTIPENRIFAANIAYQITIFSTIINILQVPYNAFIMAHEKMQFYAYIEMANTILRLFIVFTLIIIPYDKLIVYALLTFLVTIIIAMLYRIYCHKHFSYCKYFITKELNIIRPMLSFSSWDLYGNLSVIARTQGINIILNIFFTAAINAASGIATQVQAAVMSFANNIVQAFRPQIVKCYAIGDYNRMNLLIYKSAQYTTMLLLLFTIPLCVEIDFVLSIWLEKVPNYASEFCVYALIFNIFTNIAGCAVYGIHATGKVKINSIINGTLYIIVIPISYLFYKYGGKPEIAYIFNIFAVICGMLSNIYILSSYIPDFKFMNFLKSVLIKGFFIAFITLSCCCLIKHNMNSSFLRLILVSITSFLSIAICTYYFIMGKLERQITINKIRIWKS